MSEAYCGCKEQVGRSLAARMVLLQGSFDSEPRVLGGVKVCKLCTLGWLN
jgi:hypothetical protein